MSRPEASTQALDRICRPVVEAAGFDLVLVEWASDRGRRILRLYIDQEEAGVTVEDCARVSRRLGPALDVEDVAAGAYDLEVSTPGLERPLARERDYRRFRGATARVRLREPLPSGRRRLTGVIQRVADGEVAFGVDGETIPVPLTAIARANLVYEGDL